MTMISKFKVSSMMSVAAAAIALASVGHASDAGSFAQIHVSYADLNLASDVGVATLYRRLSVAADAVCLGDSRQLTFHTAYQTCIRTSMESAVKDVASLKLTKLYEQKTGVQFVTTLASNGN